MNAFFSSVYEWMFGCFSSPKSEARIDDSSSTTTSKRSELNEGNDDIRLVHDTRRQDSKEVKNVAVVDDEVQFVDLEAGIDDSSSTTTSKRSELNEGNDIIRLDHDTCRQDSKEVKNVAEVDDEVQFVDLEGLPDKILLEIFSLLDIRGVLQCGQVSNRLRDISNDKSLWQRVGCDRFLRSTQARTAHFQISVRTFIL